MSAENAWRIAMETVSEQAYLVGTPYAGYVASLPMPPAFRAAVEAEAEELAQMLGRVVHEISALKTAIIAESEGVKFRALWAEGLIDEARALLSRLEAKGEGHE